MGPNFVGKCTCLCFIVPKFEYYKYVWSSAIKDDEQSFFNTYNTTFTAESVFRKSILYLDVCETGSWYIIKL